MSERQFEQAATDFFEAFKAYDEAAISRRIDVLKYLVLASMLSGSSVDPFDAQEAIWSFWLHLRNCTAGGMF